MGQAGAEYRVRAQKSKKNFFSEMLEITQKHDFEAKKILGLGVGRTTYRPVMAWADLTQDGSKSRIFDFPSKLAQKYHTGVKNCAEPEFGTENLISPLFGACGGG